MLDPIYLFCREVFQCTGLFFIMIFAWRTMAGANGPHLTSSLLKPMWRFATRSFRWLMKHSWKLGGELSQAITANASPQCRRYLAATVQWIICVVAICSVIALFHL
jgi:hypothetical protein